MAVKSKAKIVKGVRDKIEFSIVIAIFFSSLFYMASKAGGSNDIASDTNGLIWGIAVAFHILNYTVIDLSGINIEKDWFAWIQGSLMAGILAFVPAIFITAIYATKSMPSVWVWIFNASLITALVMPILIFFLICVHLDWMAVKDMWKMAKKAFKK